MIHHPFKTVAAFGLLFAAACVYAQTAEDSTPVKLADLPAVVRKSIHAHAGKSRVDEVDKVIDGGAVTYDVEVGRAARAHSFTVDENGALLDMEVFIGQTPEAIQGAIKKAAGTAEIEEITKVFDGDEISYAVDITQGPKERSFTLDDRGKLIEIQVFPDETPVPVQRAILQALAGGQLREITKLFDDGISYEVEIVAGATTRTITLDSSGMTVSNEQDVSLSDAPAAVQTMIKKIAGSANIEGITKTIEDGELTYDVDMLDSGRERSFSVDDKGTLVEYRVFTAELPEPVQQALQKTLAGGQLGDITQNTDDDPVTYDIEINRAGKWDSVTLGADGNVVRDQ